MQDYCVGAMGLFRKKLSQGLEAKLPLKLPGQLTNVQ